MRDEALSPGGESKLSIKDVNSPRPVFLGCDANLHWVHIVSAWALWDLRNWRTHANAVDAHTAHCAAGIQGIKTGELVSL